MPHLTAADWAELKAEGCWASPDPLRRVWRPDTVQRLNSAGLRGRFIPSPRAHINGPDADKP
ncbi:hypothetical protein TPA0910_80170 [Streptomyces hygroscopicus subsp. sporocinereus]|uniref:Integrase n=1 Tax=Streptomyces hygroscopicus TaxID=1912 RepID=A0ABQ3UDD6_STRHY|nr:hypothetical protein TPA0910_80170 [Streptomyces hygroscopicus]